MFILSVRRIAIFWKQRDFQGWLLFLKESIIDMPLTTKPSSFLQPFVENWIPFLREVQITREKTIHLEK